MKRITSVILMIWLLKKWVNLWSQTINNILIILNKIILNLQLKLKINKVGKNLILKPHTNIIKKINKTFQISMTSNLKKWETPFYQILTIFNLRLNLNNISPNISKNMMMNHKSHKSKDHKIVNLNMSHPKNPKMSKEMISMLLTVWLHKELKVQSCHKISRIIMDLMLSTVWASQKWMVLWCLKKKRTIMTLMHSIAWSHKRWMVQWYHKINRKTLTGLVMKIMTKNRQLIKKRKVNKINNKDLATSRSMNLNTCHNHKFQHTNKK